MVIGIGENKANGRRCILVTLTEADLVQMASDGGVEMNAEAHKGFPVDLELLLAIAPDDYAEKLARDTSPTAVVIPQGKTRES